MLKKYLSDIAFMQVLNLLVKPIWILIIDAAVQDVLSPEVYGNYFALFNFSMLFFIVLDLGLNSFNITEVSRDKTKIASLAGSILGLKLMLSVVYVGIVFSVGYILGYTSQEFSLLILLCGIQILSSFVQYFRSIVASLQRFKLDGVFLVLDRVLVIAFVSALLWGEIPLLSLTITRFALAQVLSLSLVVLVLLVFLRNHLGNMRISFQLNSLRPLMKKAWPFAILVTLMGVYTYMDGVMIKQLVGDAEAGTYALGYRFYFAILMFAQVFSGVLLPFFSKNINNTEIIQKITSYTARLLLFGGIILSCLSMVYGLDVLEIINPKRANDASAVVLALLMFGFLGSVLTLVYGALLTAAKELKWLNRFAAITLGLNLMLNYALIPSYGAQGAASATLVSQVFFGCMCYVICFKMFNLQWKKSQAISVLAGVTLLPLSIIYTKQYLTDTLVHFMMISVAIVLGAYLFNLFEVRHLKSLRRK
jgi:O-antigen/teichoic acid export membrane protein